MLKQVQSAVGGTEKLAAVKDYRTAISVQFDASSGGLKSQQVNTWLMPSTFRQENTLPFGKIVAYGDGKTGWLHSPQGNMPLAGPQLKQIQGEIFRGYIGLLLSDRDAARTVSQSGENMLTISDKDGNSVELTIDPATKLISQEAYEQEQPGAPPSKVSRAPRGTGPRSPRAPRGRPSRR